MILDKFFPFFLTNQVIDLSSLSTRTLKYIVNDRVLFQAAGSVKTIPCGSDRFELIDRARLFQYSPSQN